MSCCRRQRSRWCSRRGPDETPLSTSARTVRPVTSPTSTAATAELSAVVSGAAARAHIAMSRSPSTTSSLLHPERMIHQEAAAKFHGARVNLRPSAWPTCCGLAKERPKQNPTTPPTTRGDIEARRSSGRVADDHAGGLGLFQEARSKGHRPVGGQLDDPPGPGLGHLWRACSLRHAREPARRADPGLA